MAKRPGLIAYPAGKWSLPLGTACRSTLGVNHEPIAQALVFTSKIDVHALQMPEGVKPSFRCKLHPFFRWPIKNAFVQQFVRFAVYRDAGGTRPFLVREFWPICTRGLCCAENNRPGKQNAAQCFHIKPRTSAHKAKDRLTAPRLAQSHKMLPRRLKHSRRSDKERLGDQTFSALRHTTDRT